MHTRPDWTRNSQCSSQVFNAPGVVWTCLLSALLVKGAGADPLCGDWQGGREREGYVGSGVRWCRRVACVCVLGGKWGSG